MTMAALLLAAVLMVIVGSSFAEEWLRQREHVVWFVVFWMICGWLTVTALLLAVFDLLIVRRDARAARKAFRDGLRH